MRVICRITDINDTNNDTDNDTNYDTDNDTNYDNIYDNDINDTNDSSDNNDDNDNRFITDKEAALREQIEKQMEETLQSMHPVNYLDAIGENIADVGILYYPILYYTILYYTIMYYTTLYYTVL